MAAPMIHPGEFRRTPGAGWQHTATMFTTAREQLIERYRCSVCNGRRLEGVGGVMMGPYYRVCRGCGGRGYRVPPDEEE